MDNLPPLVPRLLPLARPHEGNLYSKGLQGQLYAGQGSQTRLGLQHPGVVVGVLGQAEVTDRAGGDLQEGPGDPGHRVFGPHLGRHPVLQGLEVVQQVLVGVGELHSELRQSE